MEKPEHFPHLPNHFCWSPSVNQRIKKGGEKRRNCRHIFDSSSLFISPFFSSKSKRSEEHGSNLELQMLSDGYHPPIHMRLKINQLQKVHLPTSQALCTPPQRIPALSRRSGVHQSCQQAGHSVSSHTYHIPAKATGTKTNLGLKPNSVKETLRLQIDFPVMCLVKPLSLKTTASLWVFQSLNSTDFHTPSLWGGLFPKAVTTVC